MQPGPGMGRARRRAGPGKRHSRGAEPRRSIGREPHRTARRPARRSRAGGIIADPRPRPSPFTGYCTADIVEHGRGGAAGRALEPVEEERSDLEHAEHCPSHVGIGGYEGCDILYEHIVARRHVRVEEGEGDRAAVCSSRSEPRVINAHVVSFTGSAGAPRPFEVDPCPFKADEYDTGTP